MVTRACLASRFRWIAALALPLSSVGRASRSPEYEAVQKSLGQGWNTWDVHSVAAQVLLPEGFTLRVGLKHNSALYADAFLSDILIGRQEKGEEKVLPGPHTWDGGYTELRVSWRDHELLLQTAHDAGDLVMLATPGAPKTSVPPSLVVSAGVLWNRPGHAERSGDHVEFTGGARRIGVYWTGAQQAPAALPVDTPYFAASFQEAIGVSTGRPRSVGEIRAVLERRRPQGGGVPRAIETVMGWDTIYDPSESRVISPVSRIWSVGWGGYVLFEWDTFFAASLAAVGDRGLAYANALEILGEAAPAGLVPNYARPGGWKSVDRSESPVGAITVLGLYRRFHDAWFLRDAFDPLLRWNRWWDKHRELGGYLVLGTDAGNRPGDPDDTAVGTLQGAKYEGLDNSPMYDDAPFDRGTGRMHLADVGITSLYVADCRALAGIADVLGKSGEARELRGRGERYGARLQTLWDEKTGMFLNRNLDTGVPSTRLSPTNFYPLVAGAATPRQADRMVREHLLNPGEFWGDWVIPSIARSDPAFRDQDYWRGRIWGPMNYLVYLGLLNYDQPSARRQLAQKSLALFCREWTEKGHVHENYNAVTGSGDDVSSSDRFYHWGALLGLIDCLENGEGAGNPAASSPVPHRQKAAGNPPGR
ncbi:MAG TPA: trehalase family glycosidase [Opitutaceae bacterium]|nr:trehalase family glycosidase [Opitutaceae bacterium]